jgi:hypothetical protein
MTETDASHQAEERLLQVGAFDARDGRLVVADQMLPIVAEIDVATGEVLSVWSWQLSAEHRGYSTATDLVVTSGEIFIGSPGSGGVVRIDRRTGSSEVVSLDGRPSRLRVDGECIWVVGGGDDEDDDDDRELSEPTVRHPVVWQEPSEEDFERARESLAGWYAGDRPMADMVGRETLADWQDEDLDDDDAVSGSTPLWRVEGQEVELVDLGGAIADLSTDGGVLVAVVWLSSDPLIKRLGTTGGLGYIRPCSVLIGDPRRGPLRKIGAVTDDEGFVAYADGRFWLVGYGEPAFEDGKPEVRAVDPEAGRLEGPLPIAAERPVAVIAGHVVDLGWDPPLSVVRAARGAGPEPRPALRFVRARDGHVTHVVRAPRVDPDVCAIDGSMIWFRTFDGNSLFGVDVANYETLGVVPRVDCSAHAPRPVAPVGLDLEAFEQRELHDFRESLFGGWTAADGSTRPYIDGIAFDSIDLIGIFPLTTVVAIFRSERHVGIRFGRRWRLYTDLGDAASLEYADIGLMEDIEAGRGVLPDIEQCEPDDDGIIWV